MARHPPRSNTWIVVAPTVAWFVGGVIYLRSGQDVTAHRYDLLFAAGLSIPFLATAVAQIRSGFLWKNLAPGNRGLHRSQAPGRFVASTAGHLLLGLAIAGAFLWAAFHDRSPPGSPVLPPPDGGDPPPAARSIGADADA